MAPTRVTVVEETLAEPKDFELYKQIYENVVLVGAGTYGSVYFVRYLLGSRRIRSREKLFLSLKEL